MSKLEVLVDRLKQPSTWAGLGILWSFFGPSYVPWDVVVDAGTAVAALLAVLLSDRAA